jgi:hypothetical protein
MAAQLKEHMQELLPGSCPAAIRLQFALKHLLAGTARRLDSEAAPPPAEAGPAPQHSAAAAALYSAAADKLSAAFAALLQEDADSAQHLLLNSDGAQVGYCMRCCRHNCQFCCLVHCHFPMHVGRTICSCSSGSSHVWIPGWKGCRALTHIRHTTCATAFTVSDTPIFILKDTQNCIATHLGTALVPARTS